MSADALALAVRAAAAYARVRGPWIRPGSLVIEPDTLSSWLVIRESPAVKSREALFLSALFLSSKEVVSMPASSPAPSVADALELIRGFDGSRLARALRFLEHHELARLVEVLEQARA